MKFLEIPLEGAFIIELEPIEDARGLFARSFCKREFVAHGIPFEVAQCNISTNRKRGTLRGMHYQAAPHEEAKVVSCNRGAVYDVAVDMRRGSPTYLKWFGIELTEDNCKMLFIPKGFAHGFQTLEDMSTVHYLMSEFYHPESARGLRWDDPGIGILWPVADPIVSDKDAALPLFKPERCGESRI